MLRARYSGFGANVANVWYSDMEKRAMILFILIGLFKIIGHIGFVGSFLLERNSIRIPGYCLDVRNE